MKLVGAMYAVVCANRPNLFVFVGVVRLFVQKQLYRAFHIVAILPTLILEIPVDRAHRYAIEEDEKRFAESQKPCGTPVEL